jgi:hypothetical protein
VCHTLSPAMRTERQPFTTVYIAVQMLPTRMRSAPDSIFFNAAEFASSLCHSPISKTKCIQSNVKYSKVAKRLSLAPDSTPDPLHPTL